MDRLASGEVVVQLETQAELEAEQTAAQGDEFNPQNPGNTPHNRSPHNSSRSIHASSHSLASPVTNANGLLSYHSEDLHAVRGYQSEALHYSRPFADGIERQAQPMMLAMTFIGR